MRIRAVKPTFWRDSDLARLGDDVRLFYIGLWMESDDAGVLRWRPDEIAADLYPYSGPKARLAKVARLVAALLSMPGSPRLVIHGCGHATLTRFEGHQRATGGNRVYTESKTHAGCPKPEPAQIPDGDDEVPEGTGEYQPSGGDVTRTLRDVDKDETPRARGKSDGSKDPDEAKTRAARNRAILDNPAEPEWRKAAARADLQVIDGAVA